MLRENHIYAHWKTVENDKDWRWPNFSPQELASKREGELKINFDALDKLQKLRTMSGPIVLTSAYRSAAHNTAVGGAPSSQHLLGKAFDVIMANKDPAEFEAMARKCGFTGFGYYPTQGFMHIDTGPRRTWGTPFPVVTATQGNMAKAPIAPPRAEQATAIGASATAVTGVIAATADLSEVAQAIVVVAVLLACAGFVYVMRKKHIETTDAG